MLKEENQAEKNLTVGGLKVLGAINNPGFRAMSRSVKDLENSNNSLTAQIKAQADYWSDLAADNVITPVEKRTLKKEYEIIQNTHGTIEAFVIQHRLTDTSAYKEYKAAYELLTEFIDVELNLFGDMSESTQIKNREEFNAYYAAYYDKEFKIKSLIDQGTASGYQKYEFAIGTRDTYPEEGWTDAPSVVPRGSFLWARTCWFNAAGESGTWTYFRMTGDAAPEVMAQYSMNKNEWHYTFVLGDLYMRMSYDAGQTWSDPIKVVGEDAYPEGYMGVFNSADDIKDNVTEQSFFLAGTTFTFTHIIVTRSDRILLANDKKIKAQRTFEKGFIYLYYNHVFHVIRNKDDFHYISAINDLLDMGEKLSPALQEYFDAEFNKIKQDVKEEVEEDIHVPSYQGVYKDMSLIPTSQATIGDWYLYVGTTTSSYKNGYCYEWTGSAFRQITLDEKDAGAKYMAALYDGMTYNKESQDGFAPMFASALVTLRVFTENIEALKWVMKAGGSFQSSNYDASKDDGFYFGADGEGYFGKNVTVAGTINGAKGNFKGSLNGADITGATGIFSGTVQAAEFVMKGYTAGDVIAKKMTDVFTSRNATETGTDVKKELTFIPFGEGSVRIRIEFWKVIREDPAGDCYIQIKKNDSQIYYIDMINAGGAGEIVQDVSVKDGDYIKIKFYYDQYRESSRAAIGDPTPFAIPLVTIGLSKANSMFNAFSSLQVTESAGEIVKGII